MTPQGDSNMLSKPTALVLGAGASKPFGFPTGFELSERLLSLLQPGNPGFNTLQHHGGFEPDAINVFRDTFYYSGKNSVDAFLEHRSDFVTIGKTATAAVLIGFESPW